LTVIDVVIETPDVEEGFFKSCVVFVLGELLGKERRGCGGG
jgi:hypothetical protein